MNWGLRCRRRSHAGCRRFIFTQQESPEEGNYDQHCGDVHRTPTKSPQSCGYCAVMIEGARVLIPMFGRMNALNTHLRYSAGLPARYGDKPLIGTM